MSSPAESVPAIAERSFLEAVRGTLVHAMRADATVIVLGEDVAGGAGQGAPLEGAMGGTFGVTKGLLEEFGPQRVRDTPISEAGFVGAAVGAALAGLRPVVDLMWASFAPYCFDQIVNQAAKLRYMSGGQARIPLVLRMAAGAGLRAAAQHSDTFYALFTHVPGLKVVVPATPAEAQGLLLAAIADDNPVVFIEHMALYRARGPVPVDFEPLPLGHLGVVREGRDVTIACVGHALRAGLDAADQLAVEGAEADVLSMRTLRPLDLDGVVASVRRTGRLVLVEESPPRCSVSADIAASVTEAAFSSLRHPPLRVTAADTPVPFSPVLEDAFVPSAPRVVAAARATLGR
jgi:acetoin:2,6-dichlorophenolindophenol oxidoreductase subunit beta